jgi:small subunit ribosomal protein S6
MHRYEVMVILDPGLDDRTVKSSIEKFLEVVTKDGGKVEDLAVWGRRHLSYPIKKHNEAIYVVINLDCKSETVLELDRQLRLNEAVLRTKVLRAEEAVFEIAQAETGAKTAAKPASKTENKPAAKPADAEPTATKPAAKAEAKPAAKPATTAKATASKAAAKPAAKPAAKAPAKPKSPKGA